MYKKVSDIRQDLVEKFMRGEFVNGTVEIMNASFICDEDSIFGTVNENYVQQEFKWYVSKSLNINDMPGKIPEIWKTTASPSGEVNSNYGYLIYSGENCYQFISAINELCMNKDSRRAVMIYTRPTMYTDAFEHGKNDFLCTNTTQLMIRDNKLHYIVQMRSNDAVFGFKNDRAWHELVHASALSSLVATYPDLQLGDIYWNAASLHVYERHFHLLQEFVDKCNA